MHYFIGGTVANQKGFEALSIDGVPLPKKISDSLDLFPDEELRKNKKFSVQCSGYLFSTDVKQAGDKPFTVICRALPTLPSEEEVNNRGAYMAVGAVMYHQVSEDELTSVFLLLEFFFNEFKKLFSGDLPILASGTTMEDVATVLSGSLSIVTPSGALPIAATAKYFKLAKKSTINLDLVTPSDLMGQIKRLTAQEQKKLQPRGQIIENDRYSGLPDFAAGGATGSTGSRLPLESRGQIPEDRSGAQGIGQQGVPQNRQRRVQQNHQQDVPQKRQRNVPQNYQQGFSQNNPQSASGFRGASLTTSLAKSFHKNIVLIASVIFFVFVLILAGFTFMRVSGVQSRNPSHNSSDAPPPVGGKGAWDIPPPSIGGRDAWDTPPHDKGGQSRQNDIDRVKDKINKVITEITKVDAEIEIKRQKSDSTIYSSKNQKRRLESSLDELQKELSTLRGKKYYQQ